jgi:hypothetical protein
MDRRGDPLLGETERLPLLIGERRTLTPPLFLQGHQRRSLPRRHTTEAYRACRGRAAQTRPTTGVSRRFQLGVRGRADTGYSGLRRGKPLTTAPRQRQGRRLALPLVVEFEASGRQFT